MHVQGGFLHAWVTPHRREWIYSTAASENSPNFVMLDCKCERTQLIHWCDKCRNTTYCFWIWLYFVHILDIIDTLRYRHGGWVSDVTARTDPRSWRGSGKKRTGAVLAFLTENVVALKGTVGFLSKCRLCISSPGIGMRVGVVQVRV